MEPNEIVAAIMITFVVIYVLLEIVLNLNDINDDTSNRILLEWSQSRLFIIPFVLGAIGAHLFLGTKNSFFRPNNSLYAVLILLGIVIISIFVGRLKFPRTRTFLTIMLALGALYGHFFWSMNYAIPEGQ
jgi:hypothetical protein